jgi:RNA 3'-terminal phosphate cyclase (ATP)
VDRHLADQLLVPLSFAQQDSQFAVSAVTQHLLTNAWLIAQFLDVEIAIDGKEKEPGVVRIIPSLQRRTSHV